MNIEEFRKKYKTFALKERIVVKCDCEKTECILKESAINNIHRNGNFLCRSCSYTPEGKLKIGQSTSYKRSATTREKMSKRKKEFYRTEKGQKQKRMLSMLAANQHGKLESSKRQGWYPSSKTGRLMFYDSSYELRLCWMLDRDETVKTYSTQIVYEIGQKGRCLDFLVEYFNENKKAIEVKPKSRLNEEDNILQLADSEAYARSCGYDFEIYTEENLGMDYVQIRNWADEYRKGLTGIDFAKIRQEKQAERARKSYHKTKETRQVKCDFCKQTHDVLEKTYVANVSRNNRYICEREGGSITGSKPKKKKENPHATDGKKQCALCKDVLFFKEFGLDKSRSDGYATRCLKCRSQKSKEQQWKCPNTTDLSATAFSTNATSTPSG